MPPAGPHAQQQQQQQQQLVQQQMQQRNLAMEHQMAQRRAKKPNDRHMPEGMEDIVIGDGVQQYKDLREIERKLDYVMMRKRLDIQDSFNRNVKRNKTMRIWISNTVENQPWQSRPIDNSTFDFNLNEEATWRVKIEGRLLDEDGDDSGVPSDSEDEEMEEGSKPAEQKSTKAFPGKTQQRTRFSHFFKGLSIEFDKSKQPIIDPALQIEWNKTQNSVDFDCLEFERKGDENLNITILLTRDEQPEKYRLSHALSQTLDMEEADRAEVVMGIWEYVKALGLQEDDEKRSVRCDEQLRRVSCPLSSLCSCFGTSPRTKQKIETPSS